jgi:hypothetical protein
MRTIAFAAFALLINTCELTAQPGFELGFSGGFVRPEGWTHEMGYAGKVSFYGSMTDHFVLQVSGGYQSWEDKPALEAYTEQHTTHFFTVSLGMSYVLFTDGASPYVASEFEYLKGTDNITGLSRDNILGSTSTSFQFGKDISEWGSDVAMGLLVPIGGTFIFDVAGNIRLVTQTGKFRNLGMRVGLRVRL